MDAPLTGFDDETYLRGTQVFLDAQAEAAVQGGSLRNAAFWVDFHQEFHTAFIRQRGVSIRPENAAIRHNTEDSTPQHWHLAGILLAAFDPYIPGMGPKQRAATIRREVEIKANLPALRNRIVERDSTRIDHGLYGCVHVRRPNNRPSGAGSVVGYFG
ncbi:hypothetical protein NUU61_000475 [Penicillium alfredii]|uniref:Uncharacterized protein n=1 Tax=Penicillium alfredii TaxID=1506179 RepID=A0A9W9G9R4_9EURO|nr:uncharacterized protein NUU61_000475 [Penicillium alfredii]KAJ5114716.1 hypothetical protein NUU61_000475 [Penicillium alfredii]